MSNESSGVNATDSMQEYLAEAYRIAYANPDQPYISTSALADVLHVSAPAVTRMVQRLKDAGYLEHSRYRGIVLTSEGEREALANIRKHRLVEAFLVNVMQFQWHEVHDEADHLGAGVSDVIVERMAKLAGNPRRCPHGEPIPTPDGVMPRIHDIPLSEAETGQEYVISRVNSHDGERLAYLGQLGLKPGRRFTLVSSAPFNGPLTLDLDGESAMIGYELAGAMRVCSQAEFEMV
ncbi:MAG: metal-dependent transcriptional regulator [Chloroflexota bacterium]|nr:metal-dependent transcriptional regulator [Chloroflexota bacterium]